MMMMMMSHNFFSVQIRLFFGDIFFFFFFFLLVIARETDRERDSEWRFEGVFCLSLSVSASFFARAFLLCSFLDDGFVLSSWGVLLLLELNWCLGFFTHTKALYFL